MATPLTGSYDGLAPFTYAAAGKPLQTYYRIFGDLESGVTPLLCIHGGPGLCHDYLLNHCTLTSTYWIPVILYDQIGSGRSTRLPETASTPGFWTDAPFLAQLRQLLAHLGLDADERAYDVLGSSWGGMLGSRFAAQRPRGLRRLVLANAPASKALSLANRNRYRRALPPETQAVLCKHIAAGTTQSEEFGVAMVEFARKHACTVWPFPADLVASMKLSREDRTVIKAM